MKFVLSVIDEDHLILTTPDGIRDPAMLDAVRTAFDRWKEDGGLLILGDCVALDKHGYDLTLDVESRQVRERLTAGTGFVPFPDRRAEAVHERLENGDQLDG